MYLITSIRIDKTNREITRHIMSAPCMEISGSMQVASTAERPDGDVP